MNLGGLASYLREMLTLSSQHFLTLKKKKKSQHGTRPRFMCSRPKTYCRAALGGMKTRRGGGADGVFARACACASERFPRMATGSLNALLKTCRINTCRTAAAWAAQRTIGEQWNVTRRHNEEHSAWRQVFVSRLASGELSLRVWMHWIKLKVVYSKVKTPMDLFSISTYTYIIANLKITGALSISTIFLTYFTLFQGWITFTQWTKMHIFALHVWVICLFLDLILINTFQGHGTKHFIKYRTLWNCLSWQTTLRLSNFPKKKWT